MYTDNPYANKEYFQYGAKVHHEQQRTQRAETGAIVDSVTPAPEVEAPPSSVKSLLKPTGAAPSPASTASKTPSETKSPVTAVTAVPVVQPPVEEVVLVDDSEDEEEDAPAVMASGMFASRSTTNASNTPNEVVENNSSL